MPILDIVKYPDPVLKTVCKEVMGFDPGLCGLINDMLDTMRSISHAVGIAAPQIGVSRRVIAVDVTRRAQGRGLTVLVNPVIVSSSDPKTAREGCLSIPEYTANITRASNVHVKGLDENGKELSFESTGLEAVAFQHEIDHLDGVLFIDRIQNMKRDLFRRKPK